MDMPNQKKTDSYADGPVIEDIKATTTPAPAFVDNNRKNSNIENGDAYFKNHQTERGLNQFGQRKLSYEDSKNQEIRNLMSDLKGDPNEATSSSKLQREKQNFLMFQKLNERPKEKIMEENKNFQHNYRGVEDYNNYGNMHNTHYYFPSPVFSQPQPPSNNHQMMNTMYVQCFPQDQNPNAWNNNNLQNYTMFYMNQMNNNAYNLNINDHNNIQGNPCFIPPHNMGMGMPSMGFNYNSSHQAIPQMNVYNNYSNMETDSNTINPNNSIFREKKMEERSFSNQNSNKR